ncbi:MAG: MgtC/SapB family protein [Bacteroidetes bacterium]|nr:MgtC/SapB family protein [Bacteroidota bacterium]
MNINFIMEEQDLNKLIISAVIGACIGLEREYKNKNAGFKTMVMICIGSTLFTIFSYKLGSPESHDRIAANIITGIGFIGAGAIFKDKDNMISGLTTATLIWIIAALGVGVGSGEFLFSILSAILVLSFLFAIPYVEKLIHKTHELRNFKIWFNDVSDFDKIEQKTHSQKLNLYNVKHTKQNGMLVYSFSIGGNQHTLDAFTQLLLKDDEIKNFEY